MTMRRKRTPETENEIKTTKIEGSTASASCCISRVAAVLRAFLFVLALIYLVLFFRMMFFRPGYLRPETGEFSWLDYAAARTNFIPFRSLAEYFSAISSGAITMFEIAKNLFGNFFLFFPFAFALPILFRFFRSFSRTAIFFAAAIAAAELLQLIVMVGVCDIDDMILNYVGSLAGFALSGIFWKRKSSNIND